MQQASRFRGVGLRLALLAALGVTMAAISARGDVIHLEGGGRVRGEIIRETDQEVIVKTDAGISVIPRDEIESIEVEVDPRQEYARRLKQLERSRNAERFAELGQWCVKQKLVDAGREAFTLALDRDPENEVARAGLGHRRYQGQWYSDEDYKQKVLGLVQYDGRWVTSAEADKLRQGFELNEKGEWFRRSDLERQQEFEDQARARVREQRRLRRESDGPGAAPEPKNGEKPSPRPGAGRFPQPGPRKAPGGPYEDMAWYDDHDGVAWAQAHDFESRYYNIRSNVKLDYVKRYGRMMDQYHEKFRGVFKHFLPKGEIKRSPIWIYGSQQEFMGSEGMSRGVGGFYSTGNKRVTAYHGRFGTTGTTRTVLAHEGTHQFEDIVLQFGFHNAPIWILEGLAVFFESSFYDGDKVTVGLVPYDRLASLKRGIASNSMIPLSELIRTPQASFSAYHYAHAWGLIYMMLYYSEDEKARKRNTKVFTDLFFMARTKRVSPEDVEAIFGGKEKFEEFEASWKDWIKDLPYDYDPRKSK